MFSDKSFAFGYKQQEVDGRLNTPRLSSNQKQYRTTIQYDDTRHFFYFLLLNRTEMLHTGLLNPASSLTASQALVHGLEYPAPFSVPVCGCAEV